MLLFCLVRSLRFVFFQQDGFDNKFFVYVGFCSSCQTPIASEGKDSKAITKLVFTIIPTWMSQEVSTRLVNGL